MGGDKGDDKVVTGGPVTLKPLRHKALNVRVTGVTGVSRFSFPSSFSGPRPSPKLHPALAGIGPAPVFHRPLPPPPSFLLLFKGYPLSPLSPAPQPHDLQGFAGDRGACHHPVTPVTRAPCAH